MQNFLLVLFAILLSAPALRAADQLQEHPHPSRSQSKLWKASVAALIAGTTADAWSSYNRMEANPILRSRQGLFSTKAIGIKAAITGGSLAAQWLMLRKNPQAGRRAAIGNFAMAGVFAGVTAYNLNNGSRRVTTLR